MKRTRLTASATLVLALLAAQRLNYFLVQK
jgi:hypothetical protein